MPGGSWPRGRRRSSATTRACSRPIWAARRTISEPRRVPDALIEIAGLSVGYGDEPVVRDVDLVVAAGSITTVIGANGAGKSTLLRGLYGTIRRFGGTIKLAGEEIQALDPVQRLSRGLSFVPQGRCNFQKMSVRE